MQTSELTLHNFWLSVRIAGYQGCMALLLDTSVLEPDQRADAFVDAMGRASVPCAIHLENPETGERENERVEPRCSITVPLRVDRYAG